MAKQVSVDTVNKELDEIASKRNENTPHRKVTKQEVVADLIMKAHKRECK